MEYTLIEKTKTDAKVRLVLNDKEWQKELDKAAAKTKQKFDMKGFSKGKAPRKLIEKTNGEDTFYQEAANALIQDNFVKIIKELKIEAFGYPFVEVNAVS
ncbi:MAG: trigger factor family protein, partial [Firmicutes bacterium]|nr:trigger factor family protein [Bacillota bacterium]